jgi:hypothetical protein
MREARPAHDGSEAEKRSHYRERDISVADAWWANGESGAAAPPGCVSGFFAPARRGGRNRARQRP